MADARLGATIRHIGALAAAHHYQSRTDRELLQDFLGSDDQAAFAALVRRHGPLVLGVCRRELRSWEDAEDAFQATFLLLAQKAECIRKRESLPSWLHGVAYRMARNARRAAARRRRHEGKVRPMPATAPDGDMAWREMQAVLDEEVQRLPEAERAPFILCFLEGRSRKEAAAQLDLKEKTLESRLARARGLLRQRLARRGITLSAMLAAVAITSTPGAAAVPGPLLLSTLAAAKVLAAGGLLPAKVGVLLKGVSKAMFLSKIKTLVICVFVVGMADGGAGLLSYPGSSAVPAEAALLEGSVTRDGSGRPERQQTPRPKALGELTLAPSPAPSIQKPPAPDPADDKVDEILIRWEIAMTRVQSLLASCTQTTTDKIFQTTEVFEGIAQFANATKPGQSIRASLEMRKKNQPDIYYKFICTESKLYEFDPKRKVIRIHELPLPPVLERLANANLLSFLLGMKAGEARKRYKLTHMPAPANDKWYTYIKIQPLVAADKANFTDARLVLSNTTFLPRQFWYQQPNGNEMTWDFPRVINGAEIPVTEFTPPALPAADWRFVRAYKGKGRK